MQAGHAVHFTGVVGRWPKMLDGHDGWQGTCKWRQSPAGGM